jgi:hypothetical protein
VKPFTFFKNQLQLITNSIFIVCATFGSVAAVVISPIVPQSSSEQVTAESIDFLCWHIGMGPADFCDPLFAPVSMLKLAKLTN